MGLEISTSESEHLENIKDYCLTGQNDFEKIGHISSALLIIANLYNFTNIREDLMSKIEQIMVKLLDFSRNAVQYKNILTCLTITLIQTFIVDLGGREIGGTSLENLNGLLKFLFEILNNQESKLSVSVFF